MTLTAQLIIIADLYCAKAERSRARVSTIIFNDGKKLSSVAAGGDLNTRSFERAMFWFSENWPSDLEWPDLVVRPGGVEVRS